MAMHAAARGNEVEILQNLIVSGKHDINEKDSMKRTPLHMAAWAGHADIVRVLLKSKAKTDVLANDNFTALHFAANVDVIKLLVKSNKSLLSARVSKGNKTALHIAVSKGNIDMVKCLIDLGSDVAAKTSSGQSCLDLAKTDEMSEVIKGILQSKIDNQKGKRLDHTDDNSWQSNIPSCTDTAETNEFTISDEVPSSSVMIHGIVKRTDESNKKQSTINKMNVEVEPTVDHTVEAVDTEQNPVSAEPILGVKRSTLTALQRRKKKVKESGGVRLSHLEEDDEAEEF